MVEKSVAHGLQKTGNMVVHKSRLLEYILEKATETEAMKFADGELDAIDQSPAPKAAPTDCSPPASASVPSCAEKPAAETAASSGENGTPTGGADSSTPTILFGRQTFSIPSENVEDKTGFYADINEGPKLQGVEQSVTEVLEQAVDGVLPLAACIKVTQGFQEMVDLPVAILLAGADPKPKRIQVSGCLSPMSCANGMIPYGFDGCFYTHIYIYIL